MSWNWSHTAEALACARANLHESDMRFLREAYKLCFGKLTSKIMRKDQIADALWEYAERHKTCSKGGHFCYIDKEGFFVVPFKYQGIVRASLREIPINSKGYSWGGVYYGIGPTVYRLSIEHPLIQHYSEFRAQNRLVAIDIVRKQFPEWRLSINPPKRIKT